MPLFNCAGGNGGGGGGTSDYAQLSNKPQINNTTLLGNKSASDLGLVGAVSGKGLSTNDYTNTDKAIVDGVTSALAGKVDKVTGKGLSTNDYDDTAKGIVDGVTSALAGKVDTSLVGSANGVAELDANGRVPSSQLPSYVDDVLDYADLAHFPATGETGKIYIADDTNKEYRWSGSNYAVISESLALGETSSTAYAGNKGKANADAIAGIKNGTSINSFSAVETALAGKASTNDLGDKSNLTTTDKSSAVAAINELNSGLNNVSKGKFINPYLESGKLYWNNYSDAYANLDNIDVSGFGCVSDKDTNFPSDSDGWGSLVNFCCGVFRLQFYYSWNNGKLYVRSYHLNKWSVWKNITMT